MIRDKLCAGEYYHICHRGNNKQDIFVTDEDRSRLLFLLLFFQAPVYLEHTSRLARSFHRDILKGLLVAPELITLKAQILQKRIVELVSFTLMPNHFHISVFSLTDTGVSLYMQRVLNSFTKYTNTKYKRVGHVFQGPYKLVHIEDNDQFTYLSTYIHRNQRELNEWRNREVEYPWSSFQDYVQNNRWGKLLARRHIMEQFDTPNEYLEYVNESPAKLEEYEIMTMD